SPVAPRPPAAAGTPAGRSHRRPTPPRRPSGSLAPAPRGPPFSHGLRVGSPEHVLGPLPAPAGLVQGAADGPRADPIASGRQLGPQQRHRPAGGVLPTRLRVAGQQLA